MRVTVFDSETTTKNKGPDAIGKSPPNPFHPDNRMVSLGALKGDLYTDSLQITWSGYGEIAENGSYGLDEFTLKWLEGTELLVGQNIRFDMWYARKTWGDEFDKWTHTGKIWDTMLAEFLLDGGIPSRVVMPDGSPVLEADGNIAGPLTLQSLSVKYGGEGKADEISAMIKAGACPGDLVYTHREMLLKYQRQDVYETARVFMGQVRRASALGMLPFIMQQMEGMMATYEMGWNGAVFNRPEACKAIEHLTKRSEKLVGQIQAYYDARFPGLPLPTPTSGQLLSKALFGGVIKYKEPRPVLDEEGNPVLYKSGLKKGETKTRKEEVEHKVKRMLTPQKEWKTKNEGIYQTNDEVLQELMGGELPDDARKLIELVLEYRDVDKKLTTYFTGYSDLTWPTMLPLPEGQGLIHSNLNHCIVPTARMSSSAPNLQNLPKPERD